MQLADVGAALVPALVQVGLVSVEEGLPPAADLGQQLISAGRAVEAADCLPVLSRLKCNYFRGRCAMHDDAESAEDLGRLVSDEVCTSGRGEIRLDQPCRGLAVFVPCGHDDARLLRNEQFGDGGAHPAYSACHERPLTVLVRFAEFWMIPSRFVSLRKSCEGTLASTCS